jgi:hypothetical protein
MPASANPGLQLAGTARFLLATMRPVSASSHARQWNDDEDGCLMPVAAHMRGVLPCVSC